MEKLRQNQKYFIEGKEKLDQFKKIKSKRNLTFKESQEEKQIQYELFCSVEKFADSIANKILKQYDIPNDAYSDVKQSISLIFFEKLPSYDPTISTPTTYFAYYFKQAANEYVLNNVLHMNQYDAHNIANLYSVMQKLEKENIYWTYSILTEKTGLSEKKIRTAFLLAEGSRYQQIEDAFGECLDSPENFFVRKDTLNIIEREITSTLTDEEKSLLQLRFQNERNLSFKKMAEFCSCTVREMKKKYYQTIKKLRKNPEIQKLKM